MPIYCYKCPVCGEIHEDIQVKMTGTREIYCVCVPDDSKISQGGVLMHRDFAAEKPGIIADWEPGYNIGIDYNYKNKHDLMSEIKRRGLYVKMHGGGVSVSGSKSGLYGDEEHKDLYNYSKPVPDSEIDIDTS